MLEVFLGALRLHLRDHTGFTANEGAWPSPNLSTPIRMARCEPKEVVTRLTGGEDPQQVGAISTHGKGLKSIIDFATFWVWQSCYLHAQAPAVMVSQFIKANLL